MNFRRDINKADVGGRIRNLRRRIGITQAELARRVDIKTGPMNNLEQGRNLPSTPVLASIARELNTSTDLLLWGFGYGDGVQGSTNEEMCAAEEVAKYSAKPKFKIAEMTPLRDFDMMYDQQDVVALDQLANSLLALEDICGVTKHAEIPLSIPYASDIDGIQRLVNRVRTMLGIGNAIIFDYLELLENAGLRIIICKLPNDIHSLGFYDDKNQNVLIFIADSITVEHQLFRIMYELGWCYIHNQTKGGRLPKDEVAKSETYANKFAAMILMPEESVLRSVQQLGMKPDKWSYDLLLRMKHRFGVSAETFCRRLVELKLLDEKAGQVYESQIRNYYEENRHAEPGSTKRVISSNGRLGDLYYHAKQNYLSEEVSSIFEVIQDLPGLKTGIAY